MSCGCPEISKTPLWSAIPEYRQSTSIQSGENIECYAQRAGSISGLKNDIGAQVPNLIQNTSLTATLALVVNTTFTLTPGSTRTPTSWAITVNGTSGLSPLSELTFNTTTGVLSGTVSSANANTSYQVLISASDGTGIIDSRAFTFYPKTTDTGDAIKFVIPLTGQVAAHVTCGYGPRNPPAFGASSFHAGYDFAMIDHSQGTIVAAADGTVVKTGPATGFGNWIVIEHYDSQERLVATTVYGHMNTGNTFVSIGDKVAAGQKIALEGNAGIGTAMHLHFEIHKGKWKNPTDPGPYLQGALSVAQQNGTTEGTDGDNTPSNFVTQTNSNVGMTHAESSASNGCPATLPSDSGLPSVPPVDQTPPVITNNTVPNTSSCAPSVIPDAATVTAAIQQACTDASLSSLDTNFVLTVASIESNLNPYAQNPTSSAMGLYQMINSTATSVYASINTPCTCANRCDAYTATKAFIYFYQNELLPYWTNYVSSGKTTIAGKKIIPTTWSAQYSNFNQYEMIYGGFHHDGVGNSVAGVDKGGIAYWRSKVG